MNAMTFAFDAAAEALADAAPMPAPLPGFDRFDDTRRIVDAFGIDLALDDDVLDLDDLIH